MSASALQPSSSEANAAAAHQFLTELRTRIATQPLPYQHGVEATALESMWKVFDHARDAIKAHPGCQHFAARTTHVLNRVVRPLTAKWHRAFVEGRLNGRDGADEFRGDLQWVQGQLLVFATELHEIAYGTRNSDELTPDVMERSDLDELFQPLKFGIPLDCGIEAGTYPAPKTPNTDPRHDGSGAKGINAWEAVAVAARRKKRSVKTALGKNAIGLALSGGGIRSATFSLGVVQVLAERGFLKEVDFLSTVSGGGYTGSFLTQRLGEGQDPATVAKPHGPDPEPIRHIRQHARYLSGDLWHKWGMVTATLAGMVLNWTVPFLVLVTLALLASLLDKNGVSIPWPWLTGGAGVLSILMLVVYGWGMAAGRTKSLVTGGILGGLLAFTGLAGMGWALEATSSHSFWQEIRLSWAVPGVLAGLLGAVPGILRFIPVLKEPKVRQFVLKVALGLAGVLAPAAMLLLFYGLRGIANTPSTILMAHETNQLLAFLGRHSGFISLVCIGVACAAMSLFIININLTAPHRLYRDCLARTFIQTGKAFEEPVDFTNINKNGTGPYHLINTTLNIPSSKQQSLKERGCDFFVFTKAWTGSVSTGYRPTKEWKTNGQPADLATAMAISGAAVSTRMGLANMPTLTAILTLLNVRLGFWIRQPQMPGLLGFPQSSHPGFACLLREMTSFAMSEQHRWLNLSDGGHIENLGIYELLRRRCKFILCVDGEADGTSTFGGLMTLVRHAQMDFGIRIDPRLDDLRHDSKTGYSKCHFHLCRIHYPKPAGSTESDPEPLGLLLYFKLSVTGNESELIRRYRIRNPDFPHQNTLDQFFDQEQFEAYRQLGVHVAEAAFLPALMDGTKPDSVPQWFRQLAKNLLEPIPIH
jgi:hypothetical protein